VIAGNVVNGMRSTVTNGWCGTGNNQISGSLLGLVLGNVEGRREHGIDLSSSPSLHE